MTWHVVNKAEHSASYLEVGQACREIIKPHFSCRSAAQVTAFIEDSAKVEIEGTAVVPE